MADKPETLHALITNGQVVNVIVVDENTPPEYFAAIDADHDERIDVTGREDRPGPGWRYNRGTRRFERPNPQG